MFELIVAGLAAWQWCAVVAAFEQSPAQTAAALAAAAVVAAALGLRLFR